MTRFFFIIFLVLMLLPGCGYRFSGAPIELPGGLHALHVELFENRTREPYLDSIVTGSIINRLVRLHDIELVEKKQAAEAVLSGEVVQYRLNATAYDRHDAIEAYRVTVKVKANLTRPSDGKLLWQGESVRFDDFVSSGADITAEEGLERATLERIADRIAEDLSWQMAAGFGGQ